jgi:predicted lipoprotein with Yx(FWY)xxD motif
MSKKLTAVRTARHLRQRITVGGLAVSGAAIVAATTMSLASGANAAPTVLKVTQNTSWGPTLTLKNGDTVYAFSKDARNKSVCTGQCAVAWPPVLLPSGQSKADGTGVKSLGVIMRANGSHQVTYEGIPLYRFVGDKHADQVNGNITAFGGKWHSINPKSPHAPPTKKSGPVGTGGTGGTTTTAPPTTTTPPVTTTTVPPGGGISY